VRVREAHGPFRRNGRLRRGGWEGGREGGREGGKKGGVEQMNKMEERGLWENLMARYEQLIRGKSKGGREGGRDGGRA